MPRGGAGKRAPLWLQRLRGRDLLQVARQHADFPIIAETFRECLHDHLDLPHLQQLLAGIATEPKGRSRAGEETGRVVKDWPMKFRNVALRYSPLGRQPIAGLYWDALYGEFNRELSPASALLRTENELLLVTEEKLPGRFHLHRAQKFGEIITYFPLSHLAGYRILERPRVDTLSLLVHAGYGGETLDIAFPKEERPRVLDLMRSIILDPPLSARAADADR